MEQSLITLDSHIFLDSIRPNDSETMFLYRNDPEIYKWCRQNDLLDFHSHEDWFEKLGRDKSIKMYAIRDRNPKSLLGVCGLTNIDLVNLRAEFSLYIGGQHQRKGYGKMALKTLLWNAFNSYPFHTIWGESFDGSPAIEIYKSLGFSIDGVRRDFYFREGEFVDAVLCSIKRSEFKT